MSDPSLLRLLGLSPGNVLLTNERATRRIVETEISIPSLRARDRLRTHSAHPLWPPFFSHKGKKYAAGRSVKEDHHRGTSVRLRFEEQAAGRSPPTHNSVCTWHIKGN